MRAAPCLPIGVHSIAQRPYSPSFRATTADLLTRGISPIAKKAIDVSRFLATSRAVPRPD